MKTIRIETALLMYHLLNTQGSFSREDIMSKLEISKSSFNRAISDFRCYLMDIEPDKELIYLQDTSVYRIIPALGVKF